MSKYQEALDKGYTEDQLQEYFKPKIEQAVQSLGEEKTKAYLMDSIGIPQDRINTFFNSSQEQIDTEVATEQDYISVPKQIKKYLSEGKTNEEAVQQAKADYYHSKGFPAAEAGEQFGEHIWKPLKEGLATVGAGYVMMVDDLLSSVGLQNNEASKNIQLATKELQKREKQYEDRYGLDVVREVTKNLPSVIAAFNPASMTTIAATEAPMSYAKVRGEGGTQGEALTAGALSTVIPAAVGLTNIAKTIVGFPSAQKSKILQTVSEQAKRDMFEVLQYAESKGINLTPAQLTDNKTISQLTDLITRTPAVAERFNKISNQNKALLMEAYINLKQGLSKSDVSDAFIRGEVDPFGKEIQDTLKGALNLRKQRIKEAYSTFDDLASEIDVPKESQQAMLEELKNIKVWGQETNNPEGVASIINDAMKRVKGKPGEVPQDSTEALASLFKGYEAPEGQAVEQTLADLNNISKQLYRQSKDIQDLTLKSVWDNARGVINEHIAKLSDPETLDVLNIAKQQHIAKEKLYGLKPDFKAIANSVETSQTDEIVSNLLGGKAARSNAAQLKKEFALAGRPEMSKALAKRYIEDNMKVDVKEFKDIGSYDVAEIIKGYSKLDPEIVKLLAGESAAKELRMIVKLAKSDESLNKLINYTPMSGSSPSWFGIAADYVRGAVQNKIVGDVLSSDKSMKGLLKLWSKDLPPEQKMKVAKDMAKAAGLSDRIYRPKPLSDVVGAEMKTVYRAAPVEESTTRGQLGTGVYYHLDEVRATEKLANSNNKMFTSSINPDDIATMDTVSSIIGKNATFKDITPSLVKDLKLRGFTGLSDEGDLVLFKDIK